MCCESNDWYSGLNLVWVITTVASLLTAGGSIYWNFRNQKKLQDLKTKGDKTIHISKEKFDKEFEIYTDLWKSCVDLIATIDSSRKTIETNVSQENYMYPVNQELYRIYLKWKDLSHTNRKNKPFFDTSVYSKIKEIEKHVTNSKLDNQDYWLEVSLRDFNSKNMNVLTDLKTEVENISEVIRARIKEVENVK